MIDNAFSDKCISARIVPVLNLAQQFYINPIFIPSPPTIIGVSQKMLIRTRSYKNMYSDSQNTLK